MLGFICLTGWYFKGLAMDDSEAVYHKARAVYHKALDEAKAVFDKAEAVFDKACAEALKDKEK